jgi:hypothetical protein
MGCAAKCEERVLRETNCWDELSRFIKADSECKVWLIGPEMSETKELFSRTGTEVSPMPGNLSFGLFRGTATAFFRAHPGLLAPASQTVAVGLNCGFGNWENPLPGRYNLLFDWLPDLYFLTGTKMPIVFTCANDFADAAGESGVMHRILGALFLVPPRENQFGFASTLIPPGVSPEAAGRLYTRGNSFLYAVQGHDRARREMLDAKGKDRVRLFIDRFNRQGVGNAFCVVPIQWPPAMAPDRGSPAVPGNGSSNGGINGATAADATGSDDASVNTGTDPAAAAAAKAKAKAKKAKAKTNKANNANTAAATTTVATTAATTAATAATTDASVSDAGDAAAVSTTGAAASAHTSAHTSTAHTSTAHTSTAHTSTANTSTASASATTATTAAAASTAVAAAATATAATTAAASTAVAAAAAPDAATAAQGRSTMGGEGGAGQATVGATSSCVTGSSLKISQKIDVINSSSSSGSSSERRLTVLIELLEGSGLAARDVGVSYSDETAEFLVTAAAPAPTGPMVSVSVPVSVRVRVAALQRVWPASIAAKASSRRRSLTVSATCRE